MHNLITILGFRECIYQVNTRGRLPVPAIFSIFSGRLPPRLARWGNPIHVTHRRAAQATTRRRAWLTRVLPERHNPHNRPKGGERNSKCDGGPPRDAIR